tara:strand:- start:1109 stop:1804 length:696 start_codon:yes stop_codon:yes gene_type:complete
MKKSHLRKVIRESIKELMTEQQGVFHYFNHCNNSVSLTYMFAQGLGPSGWMNLATWQNGVQGQTGGTSSSPWATHQNSEAFWNIVGSPSPGQIIEVGGWSTTLCLKYMGTTNQPTTGWITINNTNAQNPTFFYNNHASCNDCCCHRLQQGGINDPLYHTPCCTDPGAGTDPIDPIEPIGTGNIDSCKKCCCEPDEGEKFCTKGTEMWLDPDTNPCKCPPGMVDNLCDKNPR